VARSPNRGHPVTRATPRASSDIQIPCFAKINLDLRVLHKRPDQFHELRTIFQAISLHDTLRIEFERARRTELELDSTIEIEQNIVLKAARAVLDVLKVSARVRFWLRKNIPMGAGLGGGSSNAAAVLIALPSLAGKRIERGLLHGLAAELGSDVPFFLYGGTALGLGRGTELYPLPDQPAGYAAVVADGTHVSTAEAYRGLNRSLGLSAPDVVTNALTSTDLSPILREFQSVAWELDSLPASQLTLHNDFEDAVFAAHPELAAALKKLKVLGANPARMTGSGSALFGLFDSFEQARTAAGQFQKGQAQAVRFLSRPQYRARWLRALGPSGAHSMFASASLRG
jgi:4-diphosphocytidyl-2-C-methyl-D-erythritol kinase